MSDKEEMFEGLAFLIYFRNLAAPMSKLCLLARQWLVEINKHVTTEVILPMGCGVWNISSTTDKQNIFPGKEILG